VENANSRVNPQAQLFLNFNNKRPLYSSAPHACFGELLIVLIHEINSLLRTLFFFSFSLSCAETKATAMTAVLPQKRVLGESRTGQNIPPSTPSSTKKRKTDAFSSSPAVFAGSSQKNPMAKLGSSQPKSAFESEVLEKLSQDISEMKRNNTEKDQAWERPPVKDFSPDTSSICFQSIDAEDGTLHGGKATVKLFGVTEEGYSVLLHVTDFKHYLYVAAPVSFQPQDCPAYKAFLETQIAQHQPAIHSIQFTTRENIFGFQGNHLSPYLKITVTDPKFINKVRSTIESGSANWKGMWKGVEGGLMTYDNIQYVLRFMVDCKVSLRIFNGSNNLLKQSSFKEWPG
jgi:DNA polymerase delta subunit 1